MSLQIRENLQKLFVLGISYRKTALDVRGMFSLSSEDQENILKEAKEHQIEGMVILSTCNRTEIYAHSSEVEVITDLFLKYCKGNRNDLNYNGYTLHGNECIRHLYKVTAGLDSQIIGDFQIVGQVKNAYQQSEQIGMVNSFMNRLFSFVFQASKKIKNDTEISKGAASVSHAAVQYIKDKVSTLENCSFLLYGTGDIGKDTCGNLLKHMSNRSLTLVNRTIEKAEALANKYNIQYQPIEKLNEEVDKAEVIIVATGASKPTLTLDHFKGVESCKLVLDLSVPRNVDTAIDEMENVLVITVDELSKHISAAIDQRKACIPDAEKIIQASIGEFYGWLEVKYLSPVIVALKENLQNVQRKELDYHKNKLSDDELKKVEHITNNIVNKIARACINHLKDHHKKQSSPMETLNMIFKDMDS
ncbi:glutamyl-tRNA reductase [Marinifilum caeruleilacunae]|uniref:Glutamyl-tRNA reductase n=1 Tax=Marinifilum caeruleilacunae TaxID=2499076 RepID=A0ABX1WQZ7_9BACT|nr:glutamyl-tRNA reductase [Marinifilum caeruleilacunae]NOU58400.1 glutamyl-tRNA reductase [Marinifilum caeruleilacunae]